MKFIISLLIFQTALFSYTQDAMDVTKLVADPSTYIFNDGKNTVQSYIYSKLTAATQCCGNDAIFVEVVVKSNGYMESSRVLNSKAQNSCFMKTLPEILQHIRWDASKLQASRSVYFELRPAIACDGRSNTYAAVPKIVYTEDKIVANANNTKNITKDATAVNTNNQTLNVNANDVKANTNQKDIATKESVLGKQKYVSTGNKDPDSKHQATTANVSPNAMVNPEYIDGESAFAIFVKKNLREAGICGLAHAFVELTVVPPGKVAEYRIMSVNSEQVKKALPDIISKLKYHPNSVPRKRITYTEFKADILCPIPAPKVNLDTVPDYIKIPETAALQPPVIPQPTKPKKVK